MYLILYIGARRTGSALVAQSVALIIAAHPDCSVVLWAQNYLRETLGSQVAMQLCNKVMYSIDETAAIRIDQLPLFIKFEVAKERSRGIHMLILSEKNLIGGISDNSKNGEFYPYATHVLAIFDNFLLLSLMRAALGVHKYGAVWTSAFYHQSQSGYESIHFERARSTLLNNGRCRPEVGVPAHKVWSYARFLMWQQENLVVAGRKICAQKIEIGADKIAMPSEILNARKSTMARHIAYPNKERKTLSNPYSEHFRLMQSVESSQWIGWEA